MEGRTSDWRPGPTVCRCCLTEGCYKDISTEYFWMGKREVYAEMLSETLNLSIAYSKSGGPNSNSRLICEPCIARLRDASEFKRQVIDCEKTFMNHLDPGSSSKSRDLTADPVPEVKVEMVKREKESFSDDDFDDRPDFLDVDSDDDLDDQPLTKLASKIPKKESVDLLELLDNSQITVKRKSTLKLKETPKKIMKKKEVAPKASASKSVPAKQADKKKGIDGHPGETEEDKIARNDEKAQDMLAKRAKWKRVSILLECSRICLFKQKGSSLLCIYCDQGFEDPAKFREHNIKHEKVKHTEFRRSLSRLESSDLLKADVTDVSCKLCDTPIEKLDNLLIHLNEKHDKKVGSTTDMGILPFKMNLNDYRCALCDEKYTDYKTLSSHLNIHYQRFVCYQCGNGFANSQRLKWHVTTHEAESFPCKVCDKVFRSRIAMNEHNKCVHMKVKSRSCPQCPETFSSYFHKLKHLSIAHGVKKTYNCNYCYRVFNAKGPLNAHVRERHLKEKRHNCDLCDASFFSKPSLRKHMIKHTGEKKYQCDICQRAFGQKYTLEQHMKIHLDYKPYACKDCGAKFVQKNSLKQHSRKHNLDF